MVAWVERAEGKVPLDLDLERESYLLREHVQGPLQQLRQLERVLLQQLTGGVRIGLQQSHKLLDGGDVQAAQPRLGLVVEEDYVS